MPLTQADEDLLREILDHCIYAVGCGAQMPIKRNAIQAIREHTKGGFEKALFNPRDDDDPNDPGPGLPRWIRDGNFILACCQAVGSMAAAEAKKNGAVVIKAEPLMEAYKKVKVTNSLAAPGEYCP